MSFGSFIAYAAAKQILKMLGIVIGLCLIVGVIIGWLIF